MSKKMLINALHPEEARIAIVEDGHLIELDIEVAGKEQTRGNIYKGVVVRVEPGLQAAFVDIGLKRLGFLQMGEIHPSQWQWREEPPADQKNRRPRIQEILRRGQEVLVQVEKGERDLKGAALTTYISLPGRYMVLMPGDDSTGISRKVENEAERKKLKEIVSELEIPEGIGYIVRTEAVGKKQTELAKDLDYLLTTYYGIQNKAKATPAPAMIYQEASLVVRTIRDYFTSEIDEVLVDSKDVYKEARAFFKQTMPKYEKLVKQHQEKRPIFSKYQIEEQIDLIYEKKVPLKSGGSIIIEPTEAMVPIDVNSGKSTGEKGVEDTAFKTNMEAAAEVARQLRLRDLGGLIVIDFIDMRDRKHNLEVEKALKTALKADKARVTVGKISQFGLMEMSRQRIKQTINEGIYLECPHCTGRGKLKSVEAMALSFLRKVHAAASKGTVAEVRGGLPLEVAYYLLNRKKRELAQIEDDYDIEVTVKGKTSFLLNQVELELVKRERPLDFAVEEPEETEQPAVSPQTATVAEAEEKTEQPEGGKKRRRRKKGPGEAGEPLAAVAATSLQEAAELEEEHETSEDASTADAAEGVEGTTTGKKKRRRRRKKKPAAAGALEAAIAETAQEMPGGEVTLRVVEEQEGETEATAAEGAEQPTEEPKKKRRRRRRRGKKPLEEVQMAEGEEPVEESAQPETSEAAPETEPPAPEEKPEPKPKRTRRKGRAAEPTEAPETEAAEPAPTEAPTAEAPAEAKPARKRLSRVQKPTGTPEEVEAALREATRREFPKSANIVSPEEPAEAAEPAPVAAPEAEAVIAVEEAKPKRKPRSRAKKQPEPAAVETPQPAEEPAPEPAATLEAPEKPKRTRSRAKKAPEPAAPTPEAPAEEKPKRKRAPRKKKEPEQGGE